MRNQGEGNAFREQGERGGEAGEGVGAKTSWFHGLPDWAPVKSRLPEKWCEKQGEWYGIKDLGASDWLSGGLLCRPAGASSLATKGLFDDENSAVDFHRHLVAMSLRDIFCLWAKITFSGFVDFFSK
jgi:hypothetical protein